MFARQSQHPKATPWPLACALFAALGAATMAPSSSPTGVEYEQTINMQYTNRENITTLVPLTQDATQNNLGSSELFYTTDDNVGNITKDAFAYISCDPSSYPGLINADSVLRAAHDTQKPQAAILYSTESDYCNYTATDGSLDGFPIYSTTNMKDAGSIKSKLTSQDAGTKFLALITRSGEQDNGSASGSNPNGGQPQGNPLGPSPSTAVAMIILYSITGVITALFLVIIVTGAVRAHRHPDRYGPRDVMGRPRQSRARGLGMAILDTIPIVKFGEREQPKPTDVELGSTSEARDANATNTDATTPETSPHESTREPHDSTRDTTAGAEQNLSALDSGIAPAAGVPAPQPTISADEALGCSICTDDFEKGQDIRVLPCDHKFHPECVDPWLLNVSGTCPLCRVDLRPTTSHSTTSSTPNSPTTANALAPPLQSDAEPQNRRHSTLRDVLSFRSRPNASADERISALRRLREQRRNGNESGERVANGSGNLGVNGESAEDVGDRRRSRMSVRLSGVFGGRRRGESGRGVEELGVGQVQVQQERREAEGGSASEDASAGAVNPNLASTSNPTSNPEERRP